MREFIGSVSAKGQITLPVAVRRYLALKPTDKVAIRIEDGKVVVDVARTGIMRWFQSVPALQEPMSLEEMKRVAAEENLEGTHRSDE